MLVGVDVGVFVGVLVGVDVGVDVGVLVGVDVDVFVGVGDGVLVAVGVGVGVPPDVKKLEITCPRLSTGAGRPSPYMKFVLMSSMPITVEYVLPLTTPGPEKTNGTCRVVP